MRAKLRAAFNAVDTDGSGTLDADELVKMCDDLDLDIEREEIEDLLNRQDDDGSGEIDFEEFVAAMRSHLMGEEGDDQEGGLGSIFAVKTGTMFNDLWGSLNVFSSPFKGALDNIITNTTTVLTPQPKKAEVKTEEPTERVAHHRLAYAGFDSSKRPPPRKAVSASRAEHLRARSSYSARSAMVGRQSALCTLTRARSTVWFSTRAGDAKTLDARKANLPAQVAGRKRPAEQLQKRVTRKEILLGAARRVDWRAYDSEPVADDDTLHVVASLWFELHDRAWWLCRCAGRHQ